MVTDLKGIYTCQTKVYGRVETKLTNVLCREGVPISEGLLSEVPLYSADGPE